MNNKSIASQFNTPETLISVVWYTGRGQKIDKSNLTQFEKAGTYSVSKKINKPVDTANLNF